MSKENDSQDSGATARGRLERALTMVNECYATLFEQSPVMLHAIDRSWRVVRVNRKWLETLGYEAEDVLGRQSIDFLAEDSRAMAVSETFPLFWRTGSARSVGYGMVRKDGRVLDFLLDADLDTDSAGNPQTLEVLRDIRDQTGWRYTLAVLRALLALVRIGRTIEGILAGGAAGDAFAPAKTSSVRGSLEQGDASEETLAAGQIGTIDDLLVAVGEVSTNLNALGLIMADSANSEAGAANQLVMLTENLVTFCGKLPWLTSTESADAL